MIARFLFLIFLLNTIAAKAQPQWQWARKSDTVSYSNNPSNLRQTIATAGGKTLWASIQNRKANYNIYMGDYALEELDAQGNSNRKVFINGRLAILDAVADASGNWYLLGTFYDTVRLSSSLQLGRDSFGATSAYFVARLHAGTLAPDWLQLVGGSSNCRVDAFCLSGNKIYLPMDSSAHTTFYSCDILTGTLTNLWGQTGISYTKAISADAGGNIYVSGSCVGGNLSFNGTPSTIPLTINYPWYLARYRANGQHDWHYYLNDITCSKRGFKLAGDTAVYVSGTLSDSATLGNYHFPAPAAFSEGFLLARLDSNGTLVWAQQRQSTTATLGRIYFSTALQTASMDSLVYLLGETERSIDWGNGVVSTTALNYRSATIVAFNSANGSAQWAQNVGGRNTLTDKIIADNNSLWIAGTAGDSTGLRFDTVMIPTVPRKFYPYVAKLKIRNAGPTAAENAVAERQPIRLYPNPAGSLVMLEGAQKGMWISIFDLAGRMVKRQLSTGDRTPIETALWPRGLYFVELAGTDGRHIMRLVLD